MARRVFITVAEVSGDRHAAQLIRSLKQIEPDLLVEGHGGLEMAAAGATVHFETVGKAAMGWRGALRAGEIYKVLRWTRRYFDRQEPDLLIGVDSPSMNFHFAKAAHDRGIPVLQYVAPQLWAWAPWRMKKVRRWVDRLACILPFEEDYFRGHGVNATFVGHPLFDELPAGRDERGGRKAFGDAPVVGLLPGSRRSVAAQNFPHLLNVARMIREAFGGATFLVPTTPATHPVVRDMLAGRGLAAEEGMGGAALDKRPEIRFALDAFDEMVPRCDLCITVSGTATLHVAGFGVPMIIVYRASPLLWNLLGRWLVRPRTFGFVNILALGSPPDREPRHLVPEFAPWYGSDAPVARVAIDILRNPRKLEEQSARLRELVRSLDHPGASMNVARMAIELMDRASASAPHPV